MPEPVARRLADAFETLRSGLVERNVLAGQSVRHIDAAGLVRIALEALDRAEDSVRGWERLASDWERAADQVMRRRAVHDDGLTDEDLSAPSD